MQTQGRDPSVKNHLHQVLSGSGSPMMTQESHVGRAIGQLDQFDLPATIFGIFMIQLVILADHLLNRLTSRQKQA